MNERDPQTVASLDADLREALNKAFRMRWFLYGAVLFLLTAVVIVLVITDLSQRSSLAAARSQVEASCVVWRAVAPLPATPVPPSNKPSKLGVTLIAGFRDAYIGQHCPGPIPPADPSLIRWARYYNIPLPG